MSEIVRMWKSELSELTNFVLRQGTCSLSPCHRQGCKHRECPWKLLSTGNIEGTLREHRLAHTEVALSLMNIDDSWMTLMLSSVKLIWNILKQCHWFPVRPNVSGLSIKRVRRFESRAQGTCQIGVLWIDLTWSHHSCINLISSEPPILGFVWVSSSVTFWKHNWLITRWSSTWPLNKELVLWYQTQRICSSRQESNPINNQLTL